MNEIPVIELSGSSYEIGYSHGEQLREMIRDFSATAYEVHRRNLSLNAEREALMAFCARNGGHLKAYAPKLYEEMRGIADGSGLSLPDVLFLNSFLELEDLRAASLGSRLLAPRLWGCTTFNVLPGAAKDGRPYIGQTFDMECYYAKYNVILRIRQKDGGPDQLVYSMAGVLGLNGMNSAGIGLVINKVVANDAREGVIYPFVVRKALDQARVGDAFGAIVFAPRASGINYQLASGEGVAWNIETSASYYDLLPIDGAISHTNHYLSPAMRRFETAGWLSHGGSYVRHQVSSRFLAERKGNLDIAALKELTCDHTNYPRCICAHGFDGQDEHEAFGTVAAVICDLKERTLHAANGNPCGNPYAIVTLD